MNQATIMLKLLFEWESISGDDIQPMMDTLPMKLLRWLGAHHPDNRFRKMCFRRSGVEVGQGTVVNPNLQVSDSFKQLVKIGARVAVGPNVTIIADSAPNNSKLQEKSYVREHLIQSEPVIIEDDVWVGANVLVLPGVTIRQGAVVGAGSVVNRDVDAWTVVAGNPAKKIRSIS